MSKFLKMKHLRCGLVVFFLIAANAAKSQTITATGTNPSDKNTADGKITLHGFLANTNYQCKYMRNDTTVPDNGTTAITSDVNGNVVIKGLKSGTYSNFSVATDGANATTQVVNTTIVLIGGRLQHRQPNFSAQSMAILLVFQTTIHRRSYKRLQDGASI
jgi:hypothetical protein